MVNSTMAMVTLSNGIKMPKLGLGTYKMLEEHVKVAIPAALSAGYRLLDTATSYRNEQHVGKTLLEELRRCGMDRKEVFVTSKLQTADQGYEAATKAIATSLERLGLTYIDLYLIHWPGVSGMEPNDPQNSQMRRGSWKALEEALAAGKLRAIGVSNYMVSHLKEMEEYATVMPMVNQFELHPLYYPEDLIRYCQTHNIVIQAYSSLGRGKLIEPSFIEAHPRIKAMCGKHQASASQIFLRWAWQHEFGILPKSNNPERIKKNADIFKFVLDSEEMSHLDNLHQTEPLKICWDPKTVS